MHVRGDSDPANENGSEAVPPSQIEYAPSHFRVSRRQWRALMAMTLLNTLMLGWFVVGPQSTQFI